MSTSPNIISNVVLDWLNNVLKVYDNFDRTFVDVRSLLESNKNLTVRTQVYVYDNGKSQLLLNINGVLPINYRNNNYFIPISYWIQRDYPKTAPLVYVVPTSSMLIKAGNGVDPSGLINNDYVMNWHKKPEAFNLVTLSQILQNSFESFPPLYAKPKQDNQLQQQSQIRRQSSSFSSNSNVNDTVPVRPQKPPSISYSQSNSPSNSNSISPPPPPRPSSLHTSTMSTTTNDIAKSIPPLPQTSTTSTSTNQIPQSITDLLTTDTEIRLKSENDNNSPIEDKKPNRPLNPNTVKLHANIHALLSQKLKQSIENHSKVYESQMTLKFDLEKAKDAILDEQARLESVNEICKSVHHKISNSLQEANESLVTSERKGEVSVDEIVCGDTLVTNQLLDLIAEDRALEDTMYHLGRALYNGRLDLDKSLRAIRELAREQFFKRALAKKIQAGLEFHNSSYGFTNTDQQTESFHQ